MDVLTVLVCCGTRIATKVHRMCAEGVMSQAFNAGMYFICFLQPVTNITELSVWLSIIEDNLRAFLIRGQPLENVVTEKPHRRLKNDPGATYRSPTDGHFYFMVDIDKLQLPPGLEVTPDAIPEVIDYVIGVLPRELRESSFHWQLSSSAGLRDKTKISIHLWFWSSRKVSDEELKRWSKQVNTQVGYKLIDPALFNDIQPHYTAVPIFEGMEDPFPARSGFVRKERDEVDLPIPSVELQPIAARRHGSTTPATGKGFNYWLDKIGDHPGGDGFHAPITSAIASYVASNNSDDLDRDALKATMRRRILEADASRHDAAYVEQKAGDPYLDKSIDGAIQKFGHTNQPRMSKGIEPYYRPKRLSVADAQRKLKSVIRRVFR